MHEPLSCRFPFMCETERCERCATPTIVIPPDRYERNSSLRESLAGIAGTFAQGAFIAAISFAVLFGAGAWGLHRAERAYQEDARV